MDQGPASTDIRHCIFRIERICVCQSSRSASQDSHDAAALCLWQPRYLVQVGIDPTIKLSAFELVESLIAALSAVYATKQQLRKISETGLLQLITHLRAAQHNVVIRDLIRYTALDTTNADKVIAAKFQSLWGSIVPQKWDNLIAPIQLQGCPEHALFEADIVLENLRAFDRASEEQRKRVMAATAAVHKQPWKEQGNCCFSEWLLIVFAMGVKSIRAGPMNQQCCIGIVHVRGLLKDYRASLQGKTASVTWLYLWELMFDEALSVKASAQWELKAGAGVGVPPELVDKVRNAKQVCQATCCED
ncbi:MAG: hypothetical protein Q9162_007970 [Coniocarpon cinnabarinum]